MKIDSVTLTVVCNGETYTAQASNLFDAVSAIEAGYSERL